MCIQMLLSGIFFKILCPPLPLPRGYFESVGLGLAQADMLKNICPQLLCSWCGREFFSSKREKKGKNMNFCSQAHLDFNHTLISVFVRLVITQGKSLEYSIRQFLHLSHQHSRSVGKMRCHTMC